VTSGKLMVLASERLDEERFEQYVRGYAARMEDLFQGRRAPPPADLPAVLDRLREELRHKLSRLDLRERVGVALYAWLEELPERVLRIEFPSQRIEEVSAVRDEPRYTFKVRAADALEVLERKMTWEEFFLSFRFRLSRSPDEYDPVLHGFLALEADDLPSLCESIRQVEANKERAVIAAGSARYAVHRYCPHQGADLTEGWLEGRHLLVCPRHRWQFDLEKQGRCTLNNSSLCAERLPDNVEPLPGTVRKVEDEPQPLVALNTAS
jgi:UDP-MurNAc hydroxylase